MITTPADYLSLLHKIQQDRDYKIGQGNRPTGLIVLPTDEKIYDINLNTRVVKAPEFLSVEYDHNSETIYFKCDRYFDNVDLAGDQITIVIQYENNNNTPGADKKKGFIYVPPFVDIEYFKKKGEQNKILIPWVIEGPATAYAGPVTFSIKFYRLDNAGNYVYNLNTLTSTSKVLHGMDIFEASENYTYEGETVLAIYQEIAKVAAATELYWTKAEDVGVYARRNKVYQSVPITNYLIDGDEISMTDNYKMYLKGKPKVLTIEVNTNRILSDKVTYQWYKNDYMLANANTNSLTVEREGNYYLVITNESNGLIAQTISHTFDVRQ